FLFVSKAHYGIRTPKTVAMVPLVHNRLPLVGGESYLKKPNLEFKRLPALETIDNNDLVVFNYPEGDSVYVMPGRTWSIYDYRRNAIGDRGHKRKIDSGKAPLVTRPIDKKDHYIKRCVAIPGDSLEIRSRQLYINGQEAEELSYVQYIYRVQFPQGTSINTSKFDDWGISSSESVGDVLQTQSGMMVLIMSEEQKQKVQSLDPNITITPFEYEKEAQGSGRIFPHDPINYNWTVDNFGPLYVPKKGVTVKLTVNGLAPYRRIIDVYEDNDLEVKNGKIYINGEETDEYTFQMNYYWMMGDNRHNSEDSRVWGFVPENHIVGKPLFIWMSAKDGNPFKGIRFGRLFNGADKR
ncbi:MAG: S26 family signal peptidase, partial [Bacteroidota bacterium]